MLVKKAHVEQMVSAILKLDEPVTTEGGKATSRLTFDGPARYKLGKNLRILKGELEVISETRQKLFQESLPVDTADSTELKGAAAVKFSNEFRKVLAETVDLNLSTIDISGMDLSKTPIPFESLGILLDTIFVGEIK